MGFDSGFKGLNATLDIAPETAVDREWRYIGVCIAYFELCTCGCLACMNLCHEFRSVMFENKGQNTVLYKTAFLMWFIPAVLE